MARKCVEENERIKRRYLQYLREAKGSDTATVDKAADAILRFERSTGFKPFKKFHIEQAIKFKDKLSEAKSEKTGKPLSMATVDGVQDIVSKRLGKRSMGFGQSTSDASDLSLRRLREAGRC